MNDAEIKAIREEEQFRFEVRSSLEKSKDSNKFGKFVNSPFGLLIFSSVVITSLTTWFTNFQASRIERDKKSALLYKLDLEIGCRFGQLQQQLYLLDQESMRHKDVSQKAKALLSSTRISPEKNSFWLYPEYKDYSLLGLVAEQYRVMSEDGKLSKEDVKFNKEGSVIVEPPTQSGKELDALRTSMAGLNGIESFIEVNHSDFNKPRKIAGLIIVKLVCDRWKNSSWYFLDGGESNPFP